MADISKIILPDNSEYDLKDANAFHAGNNIPRTSVGLSTDQVSFGVDNVSRNMIGMVRSNKTFGLPAQQITVEYSRDGGTTWIDYGLTSNEKRSLFAETRTFQIYPGKNTTGANNSLNNQVRVTITHFDRYVSLDSVYLWSGRSGSLWCVDLDASTIGSPTEFTNIFTGHRLDGWPSSSIRYFPILSFGDYSGGLKTENCHSLRLTFRLIVVGSSGVPYVNDIRFYGLEAWMAPNNMVGTDHLYSWDVDLTAQFPNSVIGGNDSHTSTRSVTAKSKSGVLSLKSNGNTYGNGTRTLTAYAHGSGSSKDIVVVDTNNIVSLNTDNLTISGKGTTSQDVPAKLSFSVTDTTLSKTATTAYIAAYHDHQSTYGTNMVLHSGGNIFLGSGEAPINHYELYKNSGAEHTFITSDGYVHIQANGQTIGNRSGMQLTNQGALIPERADVATDNVGSIGTSAYKWNHVYTTNLNGVAVGDNPKFTDTTYSVATTTTDGLMSASDKALLEDLASRMPTITQDSQTGVLSIS